MENERKKYNSLEQTLHEINRTKIAINKYQIWTNNQILYRVINSLLQIMKNDDPMIKDSEIFYGGSYFCGTKIKKPDEFDLDILMKLPLETKPRLISNDPGYIDVKLENFNEVKDSNAKYRKLASFLDESNYLDPQKVQNWFSGAVIKALNEFKTSDDTYKMKIGKGRFANINVKKSGPAVTLQVQATKNKKEINIDIDLVPSFKFSVLEWYDLYPVQANGKIYKADEFFIVPKPPKHSEQKKYRHWQSSFQKQEAAILKGHNMGLNHLKPSIKLVKLLRDELGHKSIASYYLKTVVMLMTEEHPEEFWKKNSLSYVFMEVLKNYRKYLKDDKQGIPFFWHRKKNLLGGINPEERHNIANRISRIINDIDESVATKGKLAGNDLKKYFGLPGGEAP